MSVQIGFIGHRGHPGFLKDAVVMKLHVWGKMYHGGLIFEQTLKMGVQMTHGLI